MQPAPIGQRLRIARIGKGLSAKELAERVGISSAYLSQLERGKRTNPDPDLLDKLANELAVEATASGVAPGAAKSVNGFETIDAANIGTMGAVRETRHSQAEYPLPRTGRGVAPSIPVVSSAMVDYIRAAELERALDAARAARDWKAVVALGVELAVKEGR